MWILRLFHILMLTGRCGPNLCDFHGSHHLLWGQVGKSVPVNTVLMPKTLHMWWKHWWSACVSLCYAWKQTFCILRGHSSVPSSFTYLPTPCHELLLCSVYLHQTDQTAMCSWECGWEIHFCTASINPNSSSYLSCGKLQTLSWQYSACGHRIN